MQSSKTNPVLEHIRHKTDFVEVIGYEKGDLKWLDSPYESGGNYMPCVHNTEHGVMEGPDWSVCNNCGCQVIPNPDFKG